MVGREVVGEVKCSEKMPAWSKGERTFLKIYNIHIIYYQKKDFTLAYFWNMCLQLAVLAKYL